MEVRRRYYLPKSAASKAANILGKALCRAHRCELFLSAIALLVLFALPIQSSATPRNQQGAIGKIGDLGPRASLDYVLSGTSVRIVAPPDRKELLDLAAAAIKGMHREWTSRFGELRPVRTIVRFMDEESFFQSTGAPEWTNALYFRGQVLIPLRTDEPLDIDNLRRSLRHEYTHAVLNALSGSRCPGWIDEGLAQMAEGEENPLLKDAVLQWFDKNPAIPLSILQGGFTKLEPAIVPAAYGQALYGTRSLVERFGYRKIAGYLQALRLGVESEAAFTLVFGINEASFENSLGGWISRHVGNPQEPLPRPRRNDTRAQAALR